MPAAGMPPLPQSPPEIPPQGPPKISPQGPPQSPPQSPLDSCSSPLLWTRLDEESSSEEEDTATWHALPESESLPRYALDEKVAELVQFLLLKYQTKEPVTKAEMLTTVIKKYKDYFPMIFGKAHEFIELIFGIALTDMDPDNHSYFFEDTLDLTYEGSLIDDQGMPKNCLLILILSMIFIKGSCVPEEVIWEVLSAIGVCAGREHFIYGDPRKLLTIHWVQRKYLEYREVPNSAPPRYEFLWGPRAHSEASKRSLRVFIQAIQYHP
ncbi:MAGE family member C3 [Homo sapiens]|uniref:MAGE family member C3 n=2 Tax=Homo sapiens TaxID=9606 RepID=Q3SYA6_HUMAN|nr:MAGEC3 protein [Homo sapiens]KAI2601000.1 MAGE family member C3 [Homo sapiens]KAI4001213.1 MAGE family member C3 [Homo sapiens]